MVPGEALASAAWTLTSLLDAATAEVTALQRGLLFIEKIGAAPVIIETDSLELTKHTMELRKFGALIQLSSLIVS